jgi:predicted HAD superfamily Cof-like phosphohydrolase
MTIDKHGCEVYNFTDMVEHYMKEAGTFPDEAVDLYSKLIVEEYCEWRNAATPLFNIRSTKEEELKELADLVYVLFGYAYVKGYDLNEAVSRVHINNLERMYQNDGKILKRGDGKIIKNPSTPQVNLEDLV